MISLFLFGTIMTSRFAHDKGDITFSVWDNNDIAPLVLEMTLRGDRLSAVGRKVIGL